MASESASQSGSFTSVLVDDASPIPPFSAIMIVGSRFSDQVQ